MSTKGKIFCRVSMTWLDPKEYDARREIYEEMAFMRGSNQGDLCAPMVLSDTQKPLQSMADGKIYDSKSEMRKGYRRAGVVEVGNDVQTKRDDWTVKQLKKEESKKTRASVRSSLSKAGFGAV